MSKQVCEYRVIYKDMFGCDANLNEKVNELIKDGWQPLGNAVPFLSWSRSPFLVQTMVKYSDDLKECTREDCKDSIAGDI